MADVLLFHHAHGVTDGIRAFAEEIERAGHDVTLPDLFEGRTFATPEEGVAHAQEIGFDVIIARGQEVAESLGSDLVYGGFSLGALPAQYLTQQRPGARGTLLYHSAVPLSEFGGSWPEGVPLEMHIMVDDPWDDLGVMRELVDAADGELFTYEGDAHLFTDSSLDDHDAGAARLVMDRTIVFLSRVD